MSKFDIVIFGATGYTGQFVVRELAKQARNEHVSWAVAGRSKEKLSQVLNTISSEEKIDLTNVECIIVNTDDTESIRRMCERARVVLNCVGPYRFHGEKVVKECVAAGAHHLDISGEPEYLEKMQLNYNQQALDNKVYVIGSCGFDSVPCDLGVIFIKNSFPNDLNHIESFITTDFGNAPATINFATWESAVYGFGAASNLAKIRKQLYKQRLPKSKFPVPKRTGMLGYFYDNILSKYCFPFLGADKSVVQRSQYFFYESMNQRPVSLFNFF